MSISLAPNRIHSLPVRVTYIVHPSHGIFSTTFNKPQQVYVHPNAGSVCIDGTDEAWGSIPLKAIVKGVLTSSPELHPSHSQTPDLSVYVHDPRETYLRRSRISHPSSEYPSTIDQAAEVWTGKGLVSWALAEKGEGNTLITGRVVYSDTFSGPFIFEPRIANGNSREYESELSALERLARAHETLDGKGGETKAWGIEISISFQNGSSSNSDGKPSYPGPLHQSIEREAIRNPASCFPYPRSAPLAQQFDNHLHAAYSSTSSHRNSLAHPTPSRLHSDAQSRSSSPVHPATHPSASVSASASKSGRRVYVPRNKKSSPLHEASRAKLAHLDPNSSSRLAHTGSSSDSTTQNTTSTTGHSVVPISKRTQLGDNTFPTDIPASIFVKPASMTKEQAERLLESPAFLDMLETLTGAPVRTKQGIKRPTNALENHEHKNNSKNIGGSKVTGNDNSGGPEKVAKRAKYDGNGSRASSGANYFDDIGELKCWVCGTTKSSVWRTKKIESDEAVRVCNACGLYYNKTRTLRPPNLWNTDASDRKSAPAGPEPSSSAGNIQIPSSSLRNQHQQRLHPRIPMSTPGGSRTSASISASISSKTSGSGSGSSAITPSTTFKRTLTMVAEKDAARIAASKKKLSQFRSPAEGVSGQHQQRQPQQQQNLTTPVKAMKQQPAEISVSISTTSASTTLVSRPRGRPPGSGRKQKALETVVDNTHANAKAPTPTDPSQSSQVSAQQQQLTGLATPQHSAKSTNVRSELQISPNTAIQRILSSVTGEIMPSTSGSGNGIQSLAMPLSDDDSHNHLNQQMESSHQWSADFSALFDVEGFAPNYGMVQGSEGLNNPASVSPNNQMLEADLRGVSSIIRPRVNGSGIGLPPGKKGVNNNGGHNHAALNCTLGGTAFSIGGSEAMFATNGSEDEDDVLSQLFKRTSSVDEVDISRSDHLDLCSSPTTFDFSQLPPSSPPISTNNERGVGSSPPNQHSKRLTHSALLLSSPGSNSTNSPVDVEMGRSSSRNGSALRHSISADAGAGAGMGMRMGLNDDAGKLGLDSTNSIDAESMAQLMMSHYATMGMVPPMIGDHKVHSDMNPMNNSASVTPIHHENDLSNNDNSGNDDKKLDEFATNTIKNNNKMTINTTMNELNMTDFEHLLNESSAFVFNGNNTTGGGSSSSNSGGGVGEMFEFLNVSFNN